MGEWDGGTQVKQFYVSGLEVTHIILFTLVWLEPGHMGTHNCRGSGKYSGLRVQEEEMGLLSAQTAWLGHFLQLWSLEFPVFSSVLLGCLPVTLLMSFL